MDSLRKEKQLRQLSQSARLRETPSPLLVRATIGTISLAVAAFAGWASFASVREVAHTPGEVTPSGLTQVVQHLEGGIVSAILVEEGDPVKKGQQLVLLNGAGVEQDLDHALDKRKRLAVQEERLRAMLDGRAPDFESKGLDNAPALNDQRALFAAIIESEKSERRVIEEQITQKKQSIGALRAELATGEQNITIVSELLKNRREMHERGVMSSTRLMETEQAYNTIDGQIRSLKSQIAAAQGAIREYQERLSSLKADSTDSLRRMLDDVTAAIAQNEELIKKLSARVARLSVAAPVDGIVKGLTVNTIGGVVGAGAPLLEIVPTGQDMVVQLKIPPRYIGHVKPGQPVRLKFSSFDFSRYGSVGGRLESISATTFTSANGERYYQGRARLDRNFVGNDPQNTVLPGMTVMADILMGDKTVMQYLLKPIRNAVDTAFTEK